ncbi:phosphonate C-P lyase system protein PhnG [Nesterenkonia muleiensis]|uniref:phosphonate C-P lyase system protein PhnG n=1 Tax=Nesterenkonia muleiensis TaxID=2282648 RepID=UPI000E70CC3D|nr:phosphonate C-P lyase system protein PhnG [Nesterenkonia muleiensis]
MTHGENIAEGLALAESQAVIEVADRIVAGAESDGVVVHVVKPPETGIVVAQIREPLAQKRFILADVQTVQAEVEIAGVRGWSMRMGSDRHAAMASAVCEAEYFRNGPHRGQVQDLAAKTLRAREQKRAQQWRSLVPTIVEFEEVLERS